MKNLKTYELFGYKKDNSLKKSINRWKSYLEENNKNKNSKLVFKSYNNIHDIILIFKDEYISIDEFSDKMDEAKELLSIFSIDMLVRTGGHMDSKEFRVEVRVDNNWIMNIY